MRWANFALALILFNWVPRLASAWILVTTFGDDGEIEVDCVESNWNQPLIDDGVNLEGNVVHRNCNALEEVEENIVSVQAHECDDVSVSVTLRAQNAGARGVIFLGHADLTVGHSAQPSIPAVVVSEDEWTHLASHVAQGTVHVTLEQTRGLKSVTEYAEMFILRFDEILNTRTKTFLWQQEPQFFAFPTYSISHPLRHPLPDHWGHARFHPLQVPLFNPSLIALSNGFLLATLRRSNTGGCPGMHQSGVSLTETRRFYNDLVLALVNSDMEVVDTIDVNTPDELSCSYTNETLHVPRRFLDHVHGIMDARLFPSNDEMWISFYAETDITHHLVQRGIHAAPLNIEWTRCDSTWTLHDASSGFDECDVVEHMEGTLTECQRACTGRCDTVHDRHGNCTLYRCVSTRVAWRRSPHQRWVTRDRPYGHTIQAGPTDTPSHCELHCVRPCNSFTWHDGECTLRYYAKDEDDDDDVDSEWSKDCVHRVLVTVDSPWCFKSASIHMRDVLTFNVAVEAVEKNWNIIRIEHQNHEKIAYIEYSLEPHQVYVANLVRTSEQGYFTLQYFNYIGGARWPLDVLNGVSNVRGGFCCVEVPNLGLLGLGHLVRIRTSDEKHQGDVRRFRRIMKTRTYFQFFYVLSPEPPFHMQKVSTEFCIRGSGTFAQPWKGRIGGNETWCESVQFIGGMTLRPVQPMGQPAIARPFAYELILALGINDCEGSLVVVPFDHVLGMLRDVENEKLDI